MFVVTKKGKKLPIDTSALPEGAEEYFTTFHDNVGLFSDDVHLKPVWILELNRDNRFIDQEAAHNGELLSFVAEVEFDHEPSEEEILYAMAARNFGRYDYAFVRKGFTLEYGDDD